MQAKIRACFSFSLSLSLQPSFHWHTEAVSTVQAVLFTHCRCLTVRAFARHKHTPTAKDEQNLACGMRPLDTIKNQMNIVGDTRASCHMGYISLTFKSKVSFLSGEVFTYVLGLIILYQKANTFFFYFKFCSFYIVFYICYTIQNTGKIVCFLSGSIMTTCPIYRENMPCNNSGKKIKKHFVVKTEINQPWEIFVRKK